MRVVYGENISESESGVVGSASGTTGTVYGENMVDSAIVGSASGMTGAGTSEEKCCDALGTTEIGSSDMTGVRDPDEWKDSMERVVAGGGR